MSEIYNKQELEMARYKLIPENFSSGEAYNKAIRRNDELISLLKDVLSKYNDISFSDWDKIAKSLPQDIREIYGIESGSTLYRLLAFKIEDETADNNVRKMSGNITEFNSGNSIDMRFCSQVKDEWLTPAPKNVHELAELKVNIVRRLYVLNQPINEENVKNARKDILESQEQYNNTTIYKGRNIVLFQHEEMLSSDEAALLKNKKILGLYDLIKLQIPNSLIEVSEKYSNIRKKAKNYSEYEKYQEKLKDELIYAIINTPPPLTIHLNTHGLPGNIILADQYGDDRISDMPIPSALLKGVPEIRLKSESNYEKLSLTGKEISEAWNQRVKKFPQITYSEPQNRDIIVLDTCYGSETARIIYNYIEDKNGAPIIITASEQGIPASGSEFSSPLSTKGFLLGKKGHVSTIGTSILNAYYRLKDTHPDDVFRMLGSYKANIFIPKIGEKKPMQISSGDLGEKNIS